MPGARRLAAVRSLGCLGHRVIVLGGGTEGSAEADSVNRLLRTVSRALVNTSRVRLLLAGKGSACVDLAERAGVRFCGSRVVVGD